MKKFKRPPCFGHMYDLGEEHMAAHCMSCKAFNKCSKIGGGKEAQNVTIPRELDTWEELKGKW